MVTYFSFIALNLLIIAKMQFYEFRLLAQSALVSLSLRYVREMNLVRIICLFFMRTIL